MNSIYEIVSGFRRVEEAEAYAEAARTRGAKATVMNRGSEASPVWVVIEES
jgi:hypothetical protein